MTTCIWQAAPDDFCLNDATTGTDYCPDHDPDPDWVDPDYFTDFAECR